MLELLMALDSDLARVEDCIGRARDGVDASPMTATDQLYVIEQLARATLYLSQAQIKAREAAAALSPRAAAAMRAVKSAAASG